MGPQGSVAGFSIYDREQQMMSMNIFVIASEQLLYTQPHLCLHPAPQKSLLFNGTIDVQETACFGTDSATLILA